MTIESFESTLRSCLQRRPFVPFAFEMDDGRLITVDDPDAVSFGGAAVGFIGLDEIHLLRCEHVVQIRPGLEQATA